MQEIKYLFLVVSAVLFASCSSYKQNILFKTEEGTYDQAIHASDSNQRIMVGDYLEIDVFTKYGEMLIDPDLELVDNNNRNMEQLRPRLKYLVRNDGLVKLPMVGDVDLLHKTLYEAERILEEKYEAYYRNSFVNLRFLNKRVIILGSPGGQVLPLTNENTKLVEVLAMASGIDNNGKGHNIRLLRGEQVFVADFSTIEGFQKSNVLVEPGDIIYIEPIRRPFTEFMRDNGPVISVVTSVLSLVAVLISIN